ncbi:hypothetical protein [Streptomyces sp. AC1-42T]|uniref:hypothetical protein n=1 Tax=Streptomyces sp. AC1-42T TaxID=2218665 RepID=UPI000DAE3FA1|nr:hypothetical protein [Streptomyces sp. AC1-42T]PZT71519.1 hypothetical protein DNK55_32935 [Streptomyces sp. AC1-42T]
MDEMTVADLIELLEELDPEAKVRAATQPNYPFEYRIGKVAETDGTVWIAVEDQVGYLPGDAQEALNWG